MVVVSTRVRQLVNFTSELVSACGRLSMHISCQKYFRPGIDKHSRARYSIMGNPRPRFRRKLSI